MSASRSLDQLYVILDLDRTLLDTEAVSDAYQAIVLEFDPQLSNRLTDEKNRTEAAGGSFDLHRFARQYLSRDQIKECDEKYVNELRLTTTLTPHAQELLDYLRERQIAHGIMTYGNRTWQQLKLTASGMDRLPYLITSDARKGRVIRSWQSVSGEFHLPHDLIVHEPGMQTIFQSLVLVDDKAVSFEDLPMNTKGIWYKPTEVLLKAQQGTVPDTVLTVHHLDEVINVLDQPQLFQ